MTTHTSQAENHAIWPAAILLFAWSVPAAIQPRKECLSALILRFKALALLDDFTDSLWQKNITMLAMKKKTPVREAVTPKNISSQLRARLLGMTTHTSQAENHAICLLLFCSSLGRCRD